MKINFTLILLLFWLGSFSQSINVNTTKYTVPQLVTEILVNKTCVPVTNISWRTGNTNGFGSTNGIGYFENTNPNFPLKNGVVLSTGNVENAGGPNTSLLSDGNASWTGDADLEATLLAAGIKLSSTNATVLEFDFVPISSNFNFNFLFASEEYGNFQCQFTDAFAFLLTNKETGVTTNLAVVPNTTTPISIVTIRNSLYNSSCSSENPNYFGRFNGGSNAANSATNFNGQTVSMSTSSTTLTPNTNYHIKLVIADGKDHQSDSAIFLSANSFNVGQDVLGPDLTIASSTAICENGTHTLTSGLDPSVYSFAWTLNGSPIGGDTPNLTINKSGTYALKYTIKATNCVVTTDYIKIEYYAPITTPNPVNLYKCNSGSANTTFDLSYNTPIVNIPGTQISYHQSQENALSNTNPVPTNYSVPSSSLPETIWIRIYDTTTKCVIAKSFQLNLTPAPVANSVNTLTLCENNSGSGTSSFNLSALNSTILGAQSTAIYDVSYYKNTTDANSGSNKISATTSYTSNNTTLFARVQNSTDSSCYSVTSFDLKVVVRPVVDKIPNQYVCNSYTLPALINPGNYYTGPNRGLPMLNAGDVISVDKTIYIYYQSSGTPSCPSESNFKIKIVKSIDLNPSDVFNCDQFTIPGSLYGIKYYTLPGGPTGGGKEISSGSKITTIGTTTVYTYFKSTDLRTNCTLEGKFNITLYKTPTIAPIANVFDCTSYTLPPLAVGDYYTFDSQTGVYTPAVSPITTTTKLYVFAKNEICRTKDVIFTVYINTLGISNKIECRSYNLPPAPVGEYRDAPNGGGNIIPAGLIYKSVTIYTYVPTAGTPNCTDDDFFTVTINAPFLTIPTPVTTCASFTLPIQEEGGEYYKLSGGPTTPGNVKLIPEVDAITKTSIVYIFKQSEFIANCSNEKEWEITIYQKPIIDSRDNIDQCNSYVLTPLSNGNYFDDPNGINLLAAGTVIKTDNRIYIFAAHPNDPSCTSENFFDISINGVEADPVPTQLSYCESFTFPALPTPKNFYYDAPGGPFGTGKIIPFGTTVTPETVLPVYYIFYESGNRLNCTDEKSFSIIVAPKPVANPVKPLETCDTFGLNDGVFEFDLTSLAIRNQILNGQTPDRDFTITFYTSMAAAKDINATPISDPSKYKNDNPFTDSVWIRVANNRVTTACFDVVELKLIINLLPNPQLLSEYFICEDYASGALVTPATINSGVTGSNYSFEWTVDGILFGGNTPSITTSQTGNYIVKVTNTTTNCTNIASTKVTKYKPYIEIVASESFENPSFITVAILGPNSGNYEYKIDDSAFQDSNQFSDVRPGEHIISARDKNGYCDPQFIKTTIINYPKYFTPNEDGFNDTWNIPHLLATNPNAPIFIYDRYGKLLQQITPAKQGWNGIYNGYVLPATDYWFTVTYTENGESKIFKSHFTLKR